MSRLARQATLDALPGVEMLGYGINRPGPAVADGVPMLRGGDVRDGRIHTEELVRVSRDVEEKQSRTRLRTGDLLVVLVGDRAGDSALVGADEAGWNVSRSLAVIRCADVGLAQWLHVWLAMPTARAWCESRATGTVQVTLSLKALSQLPVAVPTLAERDRIVRLARVIQDKTAVNERIIRTSTALADAHFGELTLDRSRWPETPFKSVVNARSGAAARPSRAARDETVEGDGIAWVGPAAVLHSLLPYLDSTAERSAGDVGQPCEPHSVLVVPKAGQVRAAVNAMPVAAGRGVLALRPAESDDAWWLLHEIRVRSGELSALAQGSAARELSARAFLEAQVRWPPAAVKARFARIARALYGRALAAHQENRGLRDLLTTALRELEPEATLDPEATEVH